MVVGARVEAEVAIAAVAPMTLTVAQKKSQLQRTKRRKHLLEMTNRVTALTPVQIAVAAPKEKQPHHPVKATTGPPPALVEVGTVPLEKFAVVAEI